MYDGRRSVSEREVEDHASIHSDQPENKTPVVEAEKNREKHPLSGQYEEAVDRLVAALDSLQEKGFGLEAKIASSSYKLPDAVVKDIKTLAAIEKISLRMMAEALLPAQQVDEEMMHQVHAAPVADYTGSFVERPRTKKAKKDIPQNLRPAIRIDNLPAYADDTYLTNLGETAQADFLLRDAYSDFLSKVQERLQHDDVLGSHRLRAALFHELFNSGNPSGQDGAAPFGYYEYSPLSGDPPSSEIHRPDWSQLDKYLVANSFTIHTGADEYSPSGRKVIVYDAKIPSGGHPLGVGIPQGEEKAIANFYNSEIKAGRTVHPVTLPIAPEKIFALDRIALAMREVTSADTSLEDDKREVKLGVPYHTDAKSGVRYPTGENRKADTQNMKLATADFLRIKKEMEDFVKRSVNGENSESRGDAEQTPKKETAAEKLATANAENEKMALQIKKLEAKNRELKDDVDTLTDELSDQKDQVKRLETVASLNSAEEVEKQKAEVDRNAELRRQLQVILDASANTSFGNRKDTILQMQAGLAELLKSLE